MEKRDTAQETATALAAQRVRNLYVGRTAEVRVLMMPLQHPPPLWHHRAELTAQKGTVEVRPTVRVAADLTVELAVVQQRVR